MSFFTVINCMDGRAQLPVNQFLQERFEAQYIDTITELEPVKILAKQQDEHLLQSIFSRIDVSVGDHDSPGIALVAHHDSAGNPVDEAARHSQMLKALNLLAERYPDKTLLGLWVDASWKVATTFEQGD